MHDVNDLDADRSRLVEDQPVLKVLDWPAAKTTGRWSSKSAWHADPWHVGQYFEAVHELIEKALGQLMAGLFGKIVEFAIDLSPGLRTDFALSH